MIFPTKSLSILTILISSTLSNTASADIWLEVSGAGIFDQIDTNNRYKQRETLLTTLNLGLSYANDQDRLYSFRVGAGNEIFTISSDEIDYAELSFSIGQRYTYKYAATSVNIGLGLSKFPRVEDDSPNFFIPVSASVILGKYAGLKGSIFVCISDEIPSVGFDFGYALGKFN